MKEKQLPTAGELVRTFWRNIWLNKIGVFYNCWPVVYTKYSYGFALNQELLLICTDITTHQNLVLTVCISNGLKYCTNNTLSVYEHKSAQIIGQSTLVFTSTLLHFFCHLWCPVEKLNEKTYMHEKHILSHFDVFHILQKHHFHPLWISPMQSFSINRKHKIALKWSFFRS